jgi:hypothetical protein
VEIAKDFMQKFAVVTLYISLNICFYSKPADDNDNRLHPKKSFCGDGEGM